MAKLVGKVPLQGGKSLEMIMRDSMDGLHDSALYFAYQPCPETFEILSIEPPKSIHFSARIAEVVTVRPKQDITEYLIQRELVLERLPG